ncbi:MAG: ABC transporter substrate-binding protein [Nitrospirales bacterium]|nr:MAG: ABC transporter substrate-binding protein [Nitrospirales bacterium]
MLSLFSRPAVNRGCFFLFLSAVLVAVTPSLGLAHKISVLVSSDFAPYHQAIQGFTSQLPAETEIDTYQLKGKILEGREMAKRVRASASDVVLAVGLKAALVAKLEIIDIPTIFCLVLNPEDYGLPTPNMIGIRLRVPSDEQLQSLRSIIPSARTVGLLYDPGKSTRFVTQARKAAQQLGLSLVTREMTRTSDLPTTLRKLLPQIDVLWLVRDSTVITEASIPFLLETALEFRKPVFGFSSGLAQHGATASMSVNYEEVGRQAGGIAKDTLRTGEIALSASRLIAPRRTRLALNLGISRFLGLSPNPQVVQLADSVFGGSSALAQREHEQAPSSLQDITQETTLTP